MVSTRRSQTSPARFKRSLVPFLTGLAPLLAFAETSAKAELISSSASIEVNAAVQPTGEVATAVVSAYGTSVSVLALQTTSNISRVAESNGTAILHNRIAGTAGFRLHASSIGTHGHTSVNGHAIHQFETTTPVELIVETVNRNVLQDQFPPYFGVDNSKLTVTKAGVGTIVFNHRFQFDASDSFSVILDPGVYEVQMDAARFGVLGSAEFIENLDTLFNWGLNTLPGVLVDLPILPTLIDPEFFEFDIITNPTLRFYDPEVATGYDYSTEGVPFASVLIPGVLPGGDNLFELLVGADSYQLFAGQEFDFTSIYSGGVRDFSIRGIDPREGLNPADPTAFVTGLSFIEGDQLSSFRMAPVRTSTNMSAVAEPSSLALFALGTACLGLIAQRRKRQNS